MSRDPANAGGVAFERAGDPNVDEFFDAIVLRNLAMCQKTLSEM
jgi:hypothetical protein